MKILVIDDQRIFKFPTAKHVTISQKGIWQLYHNGPWDQVWLDHDMGEDSELSGSGLVNYIEQRAENTGLLPYVRERFFIQSMNPVGSEYMGNVLRKLGYSVTRLQVQQVNVLLDYEAMEKAGRNPNYAGPRK